MNEREVRRIERHRTESALSPDKRLSAFEFAAVPCVSKAQVMALAQGHEWLQRGANVLLFGPPGVGKSHLIAGLGHALIDAGRRAARRVDAAQASNLSRTLKTMSNYGLVEMQSVNQRQVRPVATAVEFRILTMV